MSRDGCCSKWMMLLLLLTLGTGVTHAQVAGQAKPEAEHPAKVTLLADVSTIAPGSTFTLGIYFKLKPTWHTYWLNPGDSGEAPEVKWNLPAGFEVGELQFPVPKQFTKPGEPVGYGYEEEVMFLATVKAPAKLDVTSVPIRADVSWLVCDENRCLPGKASLSLDLKVDAKSLSFKDRAFSAWEGRYPRLSHFPVIVSAQPVPDDAKARIFSVEIRPQNFKVPFKLKHWYPYPTPDATITDIVIDQTARWPTVRFRITPLAGQSLPATLRSLWVMPNSVGNQNWSGHLFDIPLHTAQSAGTAQPAPSTTQP